MADLERRTVALRVEARKADGAETRLAGYAAVFNSETVIAGLFRESIAPGAFADSIGVDDVRALFNHDPNFVLGRTASKTLELAEDDKGLAYDIQPPATTWARDLMVSVERGDISQSSFAFGVEAEEWIRPDSRTDLPLRVIKKAKLYDVSPVTYPAYEATTVSARTRQAAADAMPVDLQSDSLAHEREADLVRFELALSAVLTRI